MKNFRKIVIVNIAVILLIIMMIAQNVLAEQLPAERLRPRLVDEADLLTNEQERILLERLDLISENYQTDVVIVTNHSLDGKTSTEFADDFLIIMVMVFIQLVMESYFF